jgi:hypothetical protein
MGLDATRPPGMPQFERTSTPGADEIDLSDYIG